MKYPNLKPLGSIKADTWERIYDYTVDTTFKVMSGSGTANILLVGGGAGGGTGSYGLGAQPRGAGGGGGGVIETTASLAVGSYSISVAAMSAKEGNGLNSVAFGNTAYGGIAPTTQTGGASGGPQSRAGGSGNTYSGGGGGGAGAVGTNAPGGWDGGNGGNGVQSSITGTPTYYAGGGGGGAAYSGGVAGLGGGGRGNFSYGGNIGEDGSINLGGGGGGGYGLADTGSRGGSGVVIVRYLTSALTATGGTITYDGSYTVHTFVAGVTSLTISGLNGDVDEEYILESKVVNGYSGSSSLSLRPNNDSGTNYGYQNMYGEDGLSGAGRGTGSGITLASGLTVFGSIGQSMLRLFVKSGVVRTGITDTSYGVSGTTVNDIVPYGISWNDAGSNVTSLVLFGGQAGTLGVGSQFTLYRKTRRS